ncbi:MAG: sigma-70 family RNA polymerase sigma factor [Clostridia bacterium]|nr:sigma-70 family RNA polymerase sigma factor [Clostridia bacterium]
MEDEKIVQLYLQRSEEAIACTEQKYGAYIGAVSLNILGNLADMDEAKNDILLAMWNSIPPIVPENLKAFLTTVARRVSLNLLRSKKRLNGFLLDVSFEELDECMPVRASTEDAFDAEELKRTISSFLSTLSDDERRIFLCRYFYGDSIKKLAKDFYFTQSKIKMTLKRVREKLRVTLEKEDLYL